MLEVDDFVCGIVRRHFQPFVALDYRAMHRFGRRHAAARARQTRRPPAAGRSPHALCRQSHDRRRPHVVLLGGPPRARDAHSRRRGSWASWRGALVAGVVVGFAADVTHRRPHLFPGERLHHLMGPPEQHVERGAALATDASAALAMARDLYTGRSFGRAVSEPRAPSDAGHQPRQRRDEHVSRERLRQEGVDGQRRGQHVGRAIAGANDDAPHRRHGAVLGNELAHRPSGQDAVGQQASIRAHAAGSSRPLRRSAPGRPRTPRSSAAARAMISPALRPRRTGRCPCELRAPQQVWRRRRRRRSAIAT